MAFAGVGRVRMVLEAAPESDWVAAALEAAGHDVIVVDPNYAPMYGELHRKVKTDRRDVTALAEATRRGWYRAVHRVSAAQRATRQVLRTRRQLVQMRRGAIALIRTLLKQDGYRLRGCAAEQVPVQLAALGLPAALAETLAPLVRVIATTTTEIAALEAQRQRRAASDPIVQTLQTVPGWG